MTGCSRAGRDASGQEGVVYRARRDVSERGGMCLGGRWWFAYRLILEFLGISPEKNGKFYCFAVGFFR